MCLKTTSWDTIPNYRHNKVLKTATGTHLAPPHHFQQDKKIVAVPTLDGRTETKYKEHEEDPTTKRRKTTTWPKTAPRPRSPQSEMIEEEPASEETTSMTETGIAPTITDIGMKKPHQETRHETET